MDTRIKTFQLSLAIHALIFAAFLWHGKSVPLPERVIVVDFADAGIQETVKNLKGIEEKRREIKAAETLQRDIPAKEHEQTAVPQTLEEEPLVPVRDKPLKTDTAGWASSTDNRQVQSALLVDGGDEGLAMHGSGITGDNDGSSSDGNSGNSGGNAKNLYIKEHFAYIRDAIMKNLSYPAAARRMGWEGKVVVSFVVDEDGHVSDVKVIEGSGLGVLDRNAVETIKKASPFPKPPVRAELVMPIVYDLR